MYHRYVSWVWLWEKLCWTWVYFWGRRHLAPETFWSDRYRFVLGQSDRDRLCVSQTANWLKSSKYTYMWNDNAHVWYFCDVNFGCEGKMVRYDTAMGKGVKCCRKFDFLSQGINYIRLQNEHNCRWFDGLNRMHRRSALLLIGIITTDVHFLR